MNGLPYYKAYPRDFMEGTVGMPFDVKGAYRLLLDLIYMHGGKLHDEPRYIAGVLGCSVRAWNGYREQLLALGKISTENGIISNFRASLEMDNLKMMQEKQRQNGSKPKKNNAVKEATAEPRLNHTEPEPDTERKKNAQTRFSEFWDAYPHKGSKKGKAPSQVIYSRAVKAGVPEQAIIDGARRAHQDPAVIAGYVRNPQTWLNQRGWEDEISQSASQPNSQPQSQRREFWRKVAGEK